MKVHSPAEKSYAVLFSSIDDSLLLMVSAQRIPVEFCSSRYSLSFPSPLLFSVCLSVCLSVSHPDQRVFFFIIILFLGGLKPDPVE